MTSMLLDQVTKSNAFFSNSLSPVTKKTQAGKPPCTNPNLHVVMTSEALHHMTKVYFISIPINLIMTKLGRMIHQHALILTLANWW